MLTSKWLSLFMFVFTTDFINAKKFKRSPIVRGDEAQPDEFPYVAAIMSTKTGYTCTGGIIGERHIISAAHCFTDTENRFKEDKFYVLTGITNYDLVLQDLHLRTIFVTRIYIPNNFQFKARKADIAVLKLGENLRTCKYNLQTLNLPAKSRPFKPGEQAVVAGFGAHDIKTTVVGTKMKVQKAYYDGKLRYANVEIVDRTQYDTVPYAKFEPGPRHIVARMIKNSTEVFGLCYGDSGGPLVYQSKILIGVMIDSYDEGCDGRALPSVYTKVQAYISFINNAVDGKFKEDMRVKNLISKGRASDD